MIDINSVEEKKSYVANLQWSTPLENLALNASWMNMDFDVYGVNHYISTEAINPAWDTDIYTLSMKYEPGDLVLMGELTNYDLNVAGFKFTNPVTMEQQEFPPFTSLGYYGAASYQINNWLELGTYYSEFYFDKDDKEGKKFENMGQLNYRAYSKDLDFTTNITYKKNFLFKVELHKLEGVAGTFPDENDDYKKDWYLFALKISYSL